MAVPQLASPARAGQTDALARLEGRVVAHVLWTRLTPTLQSQWRQAAAGAPEAAVRHYLVHQASPLGLAAAAESPFLTPALRALAAARAEAASNDTPADPRADAMPVNALEAEFARLLTMPRDALLGLLAGGAAGADAAASLRLDVWAEVVALRDVQAAVRVERSLVRTFERILRAPEAVVTWAILILMFTAQLAVSDALRAELWLPPSLAKPWTLLTYGWVHADTRHVLLNGLALVGIGPVLERILGPGRFLLAFLGAMIVAGLVSVSFKIVAGWPVATLGASGAIAALGAFALVVGIGFQRRFGRVPARYQWPVFGGAIVWCTNLFLGVGFGQSGVDHAAHLGGFLAGIAGALVVWPRLARRAV